MYVTSKIVSFV